MNLTGKVTQQNSYDAIAIGSGISGGWAAKELTQKGLRTLVLERGRPVEHVKDYPTTMSSPWEMTHRGRYPLATLEKSPVQAHMSYAFNEYSGQFFVNDQEHPYQQTKPFDRSGGPVDSGLSGRRQIAEQGALDATLGTVQF